MGITEPPSKRHANPWLHGQDDRFAGSRLSSALISALRPENPDLFPVLAARLLGLFKEVPWLNHELQGQCQDPAVLAHLSTIAAGPGVLKHTETRNSDTWRAITLLEWNPHFPTKGLAHLLAVFMVGLVDQELANATAPSPELLEKLAQTLRGMFDKRATHPLIAAVLQLEHETSLTGVCRRFVAELKNLGKSGRILARRIADGFLHEPDTDSPDPVVPRDDGGTLGAEKPAAPKRGPPRSPTRRPTGSVSPSVTRKRIGIREPGVPGPEPDEDVIPGTDFYSKSSPVPPRKKTPRDRASERQHCFQAIRSANWDLRPDHIEVLSHAEQPLLVNFLQRRFDAAIQGGDTPTAASCMVYGLLLATGRDEDRIAAMPIVRNAGAALKTLPPPFICHASGTVRIPVLRPPNGLSRSREWEDLVEDTVPTLELKLPPMLNAMLSELASGIDANDGPWYLGDLLGERSPASALRQLMRHETALPRMTRQPARARRSCAALIHEASGDLAATMLITGDSFGRSTAPLYYYAPRHSTLEHLYRAAIWPVFSEAPPPGHPNSESARVGAELVVRCEVAADGIRQYQRYLHRCSFKDPLENLGQLRDFHERLTGYTLTCFALTTTHRPDVALFEIQFDQIDIAGRLAVLSDKRTDAEHFTRVAALSRKAAAQLDAYVAHLRGLAQNTTVPDRIRHRAAQAIRSSAPLFFFIDPDGDVADGTIEAWRETWPGGWQPLPINWYRSFFATRLRELDAEPILVMTQCGHLDAAGHPFCDDGTMSVIRVRDHLTPALDAFDRLVGFKAWTSPLAAISTSDGCPPLRDWRPVRAAHEAAIRASGRASLKSTARILFGCRDEARAAALAIVEAVCPSLHRLLQRLGKHSDAVRVSKEAAKVLCTDAVRDFGLNEARELLDRIESLDPSRPELSLSARMQLSREIRAVSIRYELALPNIGQPFLARPAPPSPFLSTGLLALRQVRAMRADFLAKAPGLRAQSPLLVRVLALSLFGRMHRWDEVERLSLSGSPVGLIASAGAPCLLLRSGAGNDEQITGLSRIAALAMHATPLPNNLDNTDFNRIGSALRAEFSTWFDETPRGQELDFLLGTVEIASLFELSGFARQAASAGGSSPTAAGLQLALLTGDVSAGIAAFDDEDRKSPALGYKHAITDPTPSEEAAPKPSTHRRPIAFYRKVILRAFDGVDRTGARSRMTLDRLRANLAAQVQKYGCLERIEHQVLRYADRLATFGTHDTANPAPSTVFTYVTLIGRALIQRLGGIDLRELTEEEFGDLYVDIVESKITAETRRRTARQFVEFHRMLQETIDADAIDQAVLRPYLAGETQLPSTEVVTERDCEYVHRSLLASGRVQPLRDLRMTALFLELLRATGGRFREILFLRHSDFAIIGEMVMVWIRSHHKRGMKTGSARRLVNIGGQLTPASRATLVQWLAGERLRLGVTAQSNALMLDRTGDPRLGLAELTEGAIRIVFKGHFEPAIGRPFWPHQLRHLAVDRELRDLADTHGPIRAASEFRWGRAVRRVPMAIGHASVSTTLRNYFHHPWIFRNSELALIDDGATVRDLANLTGRSEAAVYKIAKRPLAGTGRACFPDDTDLEHKLVLSMTRSVGWLGSRDTHDESTELEAVTGSTTIGDDGPSPPERLGNFDVIDTLLRLSSDYQDVRALGFVSGLQPEQVARIESAADSVARNQGLHEFDFSKSTPVTNRRPRNLDHQGVDALSEALTRFDTQQLDDLLAAFEAVNSNRFAVRGSRFAGDEDDIRNFVNKLQQVGITGLQARKLPDRARVTNRWTLGFDVDGSKSAFHLLRWKLGVALVQSLALRVIASPAKPCH